MNFKLLKIIFIVFWWSMYANASGLDFSLIKKEKDVFDKNNTLLVIGGIQGNEPGGFLAASLLSTEYEITKGALWVVPNLNFPSIIKRSRGVHGDMNRKFSSIDGSDPDYTAVSSIKSLITDESVALIVNLHDGSGFYREKYINKQLNPRRWGNCSIIDQVELEGVKYGKLQEIADEITKGINKFLIEPKHKYHVKNTKTRQGDVEMLKSLTFYAIENKKAAFANEASKSLPTHERVYYHLLALEKYMDIMGIEFEREFELTPNSVREIINRGIEVNIFGDKIYLNLDNPRSVIRYVPLPKKKTMRYTASNPLTAVVKDGKNYNIHYGNKKLTKLIPQYFEYANEGESVEVEVDGVVRKIPFGSLVKVEKNFQVLPKKNHRVNVIGYVSKKYKDEAGQLVDKKSILKRYSIDKKGKTFRVEFYDTSRQKKGTYAGMFLVEFDTPRKSK